VNDVVSEPSEPIVQQSTALALISPASLPTILAADKEDILGRLLKDLEGFDPDVTTPKGRREIASKAHKVAASKMDLIRLAGTLKEGAQKVIKGVNAEVRIIEERMDALKLQVRKPLDDFEAAEEARITAHRAAIAQIEALGIMPAGSASEQITARLAELDDHPLWDRDWQEFKDTAQKAGTATANALKVAQADAMKREGEEAEAARLRAEEDEERRQAEETEIEEREARIAAEAAEQARREAEAKAAEEAAQVERRAQAERDQIEAERVAAEQRERDERERAERAERKKAEAEARAEAARVRAHVDALTAIAEALEYGERESAAEIGRRLEYLLNYPAREWEEYADRAAEALAVEIARTRELLAAAEEREAQKAEADRLAAVEREEKAAQEAAAAERRRQELEAARAAEEARKREANIAHRRKTNREAADAIVLAISDVHSGNADEAQAFAQAVVTAIAKRAVPHVTIAY
jgi:colicin import membrane protein